MSTHPHLPTRASAVVLVACSLVAAAGAPDRPALPLDTADAGAVAIPLGGYRFAKKLKGPAFMDLYGNPGDAGFLRTLELKSGFRSEPHWHDADKHGFVLKGYLSQDPVSLPQDDARKVGPGGYFGVRAGVVHTTYCWPGEDCVVAYFMPGPLVTHMVDAGTR